MVFGQQVSTLLNEWRRQMVEARGTLHGQDAQMIAAHLIEHDHIEGSRGRPLFVKPAYMETGGIGSSVDELVDDSLIAVKGEHDGLVCCEVFYEGGVI